MNRLSLLLLCSLVTFLLAGCASAPPPRPVETTVAIPPKPEATVLGRALAPVLADHPGLSGVYPLEKGVDAFAARMALAAVATNTLDVQYYIWHPDDTGKLLARQLIEAANRGVHVRLLLDDIGSSPSDPHLLALDSHTNIEVRLFNPLAHRRFRGLAFLFDFNRINRRMHNKSFTADHQVTIIGGRNIGDEYFGAGPGVEFADMDAMAVGPVVAEATRSFELFWNNPSTLPISSVTREKVSPDWVKKHWAALEADCEALRDSHYIQAVRDSRLVNEIEERKLEFYWGRAALAYDLPEKITTAPDDRATHLTPQLRPVVDATTKQLVIVSPYFVPGNEGVEFFKSLRKRGVRVVIVTNSLGATDVAAVHAGYKRYRKALLRAGVELYEFKKTASLDDDSKKDKADHSTGSSGASLHAKTFVFDERIIFVGSLNLDPRSAALNTEIGALFEVPDLAAQMTRGIEQNALKNSYRLEFIPGPGPCKECGDIVWHDEEKGEPVTYNREPGASFSRRLLMPILSLLPIESQL